MKCKHCGSQYLNTYFQTIKGIQHLRGECLQCGRGLGFIKQNLPVGDFTFYSGKHKGKMIKNVWEIDQGYVVWACENYPNPKVQRECRMYMRDLLKEEGFRVPDSAMNAMGTLCDEDPTMAT